MSAAGSASERFSALAAPGCPLLESSAQVRRKQTGTSTDTRAWERLSLPLAIGSAALTFVLAAPARAEEPLWGESAFMPP